MQVDEPRDFYERYNRFYVGAKFGYFYNFDKLNATRLYMEVNSHTYRPRFPVRLYHVDTNLDYVYKLDSSRTEFHSIYTGLFIGDQILEKIYHPISDTLEHGINLGYMAMLDSKHIFEVGVKYFLSDSILFTQGEESDINSYYYLDRGIVVGHSEESPYVFLFGFSYGYLF